MGLKTLLQHRHTQEHTHTHPSTYSTQTHTSASSFFNMFSTLLMSHDQIHIMLQTKHAVLKWNKSLWDQEGTHTLWYNTVPPSSITANVPAVLTLPLYSVFLSTWFGKTGQTLLRHFRNNIFSFSANLRNTCKCGDDIKPNWNELLLIFTPFWLQFAIIHQLFLFIKVFHLWWMKARVQLCTTMKCKPCQQCMFRPPVRNSKQVRLWWCHSYQRLVFLLNISY